MGQLPLVRIIESFQFSSIGEIPQDKKYHGEKSELIIGDGNTIREYVTINRGTEEDQGFTKIGDRNWIMAYVHIAHDCNVKNDITFANGSTLAGTCNRRRFCNLRWVYVGASVLSHW